jgi:hypothetical protein
METYSQIRMPDIFNIIIFYKKRENNSEAGLLPLSGNSMKRPVGSIPDRG